ncbi:MAG: hypothetical protein L0221_17020, partial [Chloroflexi bacterium]|nr:hypothetical protein [Chloroflexota bacterium]
RRDAARLLSTAALDCIGVAKRDDPVQGVKQGERAYRVRIFKDAQFGGPGLDDDLGHAPVWRQGFVRGHIPGVGRRGTWDLLGGALGVLLKGRLDPYVPTAPATATEEPPEDAALADVVAEREKQRAKWGDAHDDAHEDGYLSAAASFLALDAAPEPTTPMWLRIALLYSKRDRLVLAGALLLAEIERLDRAAERTA